MAKNGHIYTYDALQQVGFPALVYPQTSGTGLGNTTYRWNLYATGGNFSSAVDVGGALSVDGNISTKGTLTVGTSSANKATTLYGNLTMAAGAITAHSTTSATDTNAGINFGSGTSTAHIGYATGVKVLGLYSAGKIALRPSGVASPNGLELDDTSIKFNEKELITASGTSAQFIKGDGSLDSTAYLPLSGGTMTGAIMLSDNNAARIRKDWDSADNTSAFTCNYSGTTTTGFARNAVLLAVDNNAYFRIGIYGSYKKASDLASGEVNEPTYMFIGNGGYDATNLRIYTNGSLQ